MVVLCVLVGILELIVGIAWIVQFHDSFVYIGVGIGYIITGLIMFYIAYLGSTHISKDEHDKEIKHLIEELREANDRIDAILINSKFHGIKMPNRTE